MSFKVIAVFTAILAVSITYIHEYHHDKVLLLNKIPLVKRSMFIIHNFIKKVSHSLSFSNYQLNEPEGSERLYSGDELSRFNGEEGSVGLYLAILGKVYDVSKGSKHYGPGGSYHAFAGRDASRAFVTGDFSEQGATDDVTGLSQDDLKSLQDWSQFYHKEYTYKGKLVGQYYTLKGERTEYYEKVEDLIKQAIENNAAQNVDYQKYPPCNAEWTPETGSKVWCSNRSGGIERDWAGVPRKYYKPGSDSHRCACIQLIDDEKLSPQKQREGNLEQYAGCPPASDSCFIKVEN